MIAHLDVPRFDGRPLCAETDPDAFFPELGQPTREAKALCRRCDVRTECLEWALARREPYGVWGGLSERERRRLLGPAGDGRRQQPINHGTPGGARAHNRRGEDPCAACKQAYRDRRKAAA